MVNDNELLQQYVRNGSETAFADLVSRHVGLVYSAALRQVGRPEIAEEISQVVFTILARKASQLSKETILSGWLFRTTRFAALNTLREESRRANRERESFFMSTSNNENESLWRQIEPQLDPAMDCLSEADRNAVLLRYFEHRSLREIGQTLGVSDDTAQKRISRALDKLRVFLEKRKISVTVGMLASLLPAKSVAAIPVGLSVSIATAANSCIALQTASVSTLINSTMNIIAWTNIKTAAPIAAIGLLVAGAPIAYQFNQISNLKERNAALVEEQKRLAAGYLNPDALKRFNGNERELERLRRDAGELPELRAKVAELSRQKTEREQAIAKLNNDQARIAAQLRAAKQTSEVSADKLADVEENEARKIVVTGVKKLGLAFHMAKNELGRWPTNLDEIANRYSSDPSLVADFKSRFKFVHHPNLEELTKHSNVIVLMEHFPRRLRNGQTEWSLGMSDGSVMITTNPPPTSLTFPRQSQP